jgi:hypothetical protein
VTRNRVQIASPDGPAAGFTPRHSRSFTAVTHSIVPDSYDNFGSRVLAHETGRCAVPAIDDPNR